MGDQGWGRLDRPEARRGAKERNEWWHASDACGTIVTNSCCPCPTLAEMVRVLNLPLTKSLPRERCACAILILLTAGCANLGKYIWVDEYTGTSQASAKGYVIAPGDIISVRVYNQEAMSARERVRADGKVSLPFLNDVEAAGYMPTALGQQLQTRFKEFVNLPVVTVTLEEVRQMPVSLLGEVAKPGLYLLEPGAGVLQAIALGAGLTDFAHRDRIFVVRQTPQPIRIRFQYEALAHGDGRAAQFHLQGGDVVVVE